MRQALTIAMILAALSATALAAATHQGFSVQGQLLDEQGLNPIRDQVDLQIAIYAPDGECLLYSEAQNSIDLSSTNGVFSLSVGSGVFPSADALKRSGADPGLTMAQIFSNRGAIRAAGSPNCAAGYTPQNADGRKLRLTVTQQSNGITETLSPDQLISSVPQATVAETLQGLEPHRFVQITGNSSEYILGKTALDTLSGLEGVQDASALHNHDALYAKLAGSSSVSLSSGSYLGLGVHTAVPDTTGWAGDLTKIGRTWFDSNSGEIKYWDGATVKTLGTSGAAVASFNGRAGVVSLTSSDVTTALGFTPEAALSANDSTKYYRGDKTWQILNTSAIPEGTNKYFTSARARAELGSGTGIFYDFITGIISADVGTAANQLVRLDANAKLPAVDASLLTSLNAGQISSGSLDVGRIADGSIPVAKLAPTIGSWGSDGTNVYRTSGKVGIGTPNPSTALEVKGSVSLAGSVSGRVELKAPSSGGAATFVLPAGAGTSGQVLSTDGAGILSWAAPSVSWGSQSASAVFAAPVGTPGTPAFRTLESDDIPALDAVKITSGTLSVARGGTGLSTLGIFQTLTTSNSGGITPVAASAGGQVLMQDSVSSAPGFAQITNANISSTAAIADSKLATLSSTGKVANSATTATSVNTPSTIVARAADGSFAAGAITSNSAVTADGSMTAGGTITAGGGFSGSGASLTGLNASNLSGGTVAAARMPGLIGDVTSTAGTTVTTVTKLQGMGIATTAPITGQVLRYNGTSWAPATLASCPVGMSAIGTLGSGGFCISTDPETVMTWLSAVTTCAGKSPEARLCTTDEWTMACVKQGWTLSIPGEWVGAHLNNIEAFTLGQDGINSTFGCDQNSGIDKTLFRPFRCCLKP